MEDPAEDVFPDFIRDLPPPAGDTQLTCYLSSGDRGLVMFFEAIDGDKVVPEHVHGDQLGIVLKGAVRIKIGDAVHECRRGDTYFVPAGVPHVTWVKQGTQGLDIFAEHDRYLPRAR